MVRPTRASSLVTALGLFTVLPVPPVADIDRVQAGRAMRAFPWVGIVVGTPAAGLWWLTHLVGGELLGAVLALGLMALLTGALHLDGVADTADGLGSRKDRAEALAIMKRSDIGPMGVISLVFVLLLQLGALVTTPRPALVIVALVVCPAIARQTVVMACAEDLPSARPGGFGALFHSSLTWRQAWFTQVAVLVVAMVLGYWAAGLPGTALLTLTTALGHLAGRAWQTRMRQRLGGMTGDTFGSLIEWVQTVALVVVALGAGLMTRVGLLG